MKILYVEDHDALRYGIGREMRAHGHEVFDAQDAEAALDILERHEIEVLVTDIGLPGMSGEVFAAEARRLRPTLRLIFATGLDHIKAPVDAPADGPIVLRKPYTWDDLAEALQRQR